MPYPMPTAGPLADFYDDWNAWLSQAYGLKVLSIRGAYLYRVNAFFNQVLPRHKLPELLAITTDQWPDFFRRADLSASVEATTWKALGRFYEFAMFRELISTNPWVGFPYGANRQISALEQFMESWGLDLARDGEQPWAREDYRQRCVRFFKRNKLLFDPKIFSYLTRETFLDYFDAEEINGKRRRVNFRMFEKMLDAAVSRGFADSNVLAGQWHAFRPTEAAVVVEQETLDVAEIATLESRILRGPGDEWLILQDLALVGLFYIHRMRPAEAFGLRRFGESKYGFHVRGKGLQYINLTDECLRRLSTHLSFVPYRTTDSDPIFWGPNGLPLDEVWLGKRWRAIPAGTGNLTANLLRRSQLQHFKEDGASVEQIQAWSRLKHGITIAKTLDVSFPDIQQKYTRTHPRYDSR